MVGLIGQQYNLFEISVRNRKVVTEVMVSYAVIVTAISMQIS